MLSAIIIDMVYCKKDLIILAATNTTETTVSSEHLCL